MFQFFPSAFSAKTRFQFELIYWFLFYKTFSMCFRQWRDHVTMPLWTLWLKDTGMVCKVTLKLLVVMKPNRQTLCSSTSTKHFYFLEEEEKAINCFLMFVIFTKHGRHTIGCFRLYCKQKRTFTFKSWTRDQIFTMTICIIWFTMQFMRVLFLRSGNDYSVVSC